MEIDEIAANWDRAEVLFRSRTPFALGNKAVKSRTPDIYGNQRNLMECREIYENS